MSRKDRLTGFAEQIGFGVETDAASGIVRAVRVPCLVADRVPGTCTVEASYDPTTGKPDKRIGNAVHAVKITIDGEYDGRVYYADGTPIGNYLNGDKKTWSEISIRKGGKGKPEDDETAHDLLHRYAKSIVGAVWEAKHSGAVSIEDPGPFHIPNTFEARAAIAPVQDPIRGQRIAIIGLGGTGSYVLDQIVKTPVAEIHLLDSDYLEWHNLMRAPGAPTAEEIDLVRAGCLRKVDYYHSKYGSLREGIYPHPVSVESTSMFAEFLSVHPIDYAFVCIDQLTEGETSRQDVVYRALSETGVPFIDAGVSITLQDCVVTGSVSISAYAAGSELWKNVIPNARLEGGALGYRNVQLPEVNATAAGLAVMQWRRCTGQYVSETDSPLHKLRLEKARIFHG